MTAARDVGVVEMVPASSARRARTGPGSPPLARPGSSRRRLRVLGTAVAGLLLPELVEDAPGQGDLALTGGQVEGGGEAVLALDLHVDPLRPARHGVPEAGNGQLIADLEPVVGRLVDQEGEQALGDQVAPVDAGQALGQDAADAEGEGGQGGVLTAGPLAVVLPGHDEAAAPALGPLDELWVLL